jgi:hypothetical protein
VAGYFQHTLTPALAARVGSVALAHLDADLYSSTTAALDFLTPLLDSGSLLLFDQFTGGEGSEQRAFLDWTCRTGTQAIPVAEFWREPSGGGGAVMDRRVLVQILGPRHLRHAGWPGALRADYTTAPDIVPLGSGLRLGSGWYPLETYAGETFRWVNNDAELSVEPAAAGTLALELEPGPGLGTRPFDLQVLDASGHAVETVPVSHRQMVRVHLRTGTYRLHVGGGGQPCPGDWRILNVRVFRITATPEP